jgi:hypothetical protein
MRISDADYTSENDFDSDLYEAPREKYIPGNSKPAKGRIISYQQTSEEPNTNLSLDVSAGKALTIIAMFMFMFLLPVGLIEGAFNFDNLLRQEIYTSSVIAQNSNTNTNSANSGRVAGAADTQPKQSSSNQSQAQSQSLVERLRTREILGIPVRVILIVIGILLIVLPLLILIA